MIIGQCPIISITIISQPINFYQLTIANHHTFFITHQDICAHNIIPVLALTSTCIPACATFLSSGIGEFCIASISASITGYILHTVNKKLCKKTKVESSYILPPSQFPNPNNNNDPDDNKDHNNVIVANNMTEFFEKTPVGRAIKHHV